MIWLNNAVSFHTTLNLLNNLECCNVVIARGPSVMVFSFEQKGIPLPFLYFLWSCSKNIKLFMPFYSLDSSIWLEYLFKESLVKCISVPERFKVQ